MAISLWGRQIRAAIFAVLATFCVLTGPMEAAAQESGGNPPSEESGGVTTEWIEGFFTWKVETEFADRKAEARERLDSLPCATCSIFSSFSTAVFKASNSVDAAGAGLRAVLTGFASLFALYYLGSAFVSGDASDLLGRWQTFWRLCLAVCAGSIFLGAPLSYAWEYIFWPLFSIGEGLVNLVDGSSASCAGVNGGVMPTGINPAGAAKAVASMGRTVCGTYGMTLDGISNGLALIEQSGNIIESIVYVIAGGMIVFLYGYLAIIFPLRFIDVIVKLAIVGFLTPLLGLCAVFKPTRGYVGIAISNVLNATAQFAIMSIIFKIGDTVFTEMAADLTIGGDNFTDAIMNAFIMFGTAFVFVNLVNSVPAIASEIARHSGAGGSEGAKAATGVVGKSTSVAASGSGAVLRMAPAGAGKLAVGAGKAIGLGKGVK